jgi:hypothetical protein
MSKNDEQKEHVRQRQEEGAVFLAKATGVPLEKVKELIEAARQWEDETAEGETYIADRPDETVENKEEAA